MAPELLDGNSCRVSEKVRNLCLSVLVTLVLTKRLKVDRASAVLENVILSACIFLSPVG